LRVPASLKYVVPDGTIDSGESGCGYKYVVPDGTNDSGECG
jgi:hypothetical protein